MSQNQEVTSRFKGRYLFNKVNINELAAQQSLPTLRISQPCSFESPKLSFDPFYYRDHVTLKKYSYQNLKNASSSKRMKTESQNEQMWRKTQQLKMLNVIQYINLYNEIKSNRNNILVHGSQNNQNVKKVKQKQQEKTTSFMQQDNNSIINESNIQQIEVTSKSANKKSARFDSSTKVQIRKTQQNEKENIQKLNNMIRTKMKMNTDIYNMNKELLRDYLNDKKQYDLSFNCFTKDQDNLNVKLRKIKKLVKVLNTTGDKQNQTKFKATSSETKLSDKKKLDERVSNPKSKVSQQLNKLVRFKTEQCPQSSTNQQFTFLQNRSRIKKKKDSKNDKICTQRSKLKKTTFFSDVKKKSKQDQMIQIQLNKIDRQIINKYRRDAQFSLNKNIPVHEITKLRSKGMRKSTSKIVSNKIRSNA